MERLRENGVGGGESCCRSVGKVDLDDATRIVYQRALDFWASFGIDLLDLPLREDVWCDRGNYRVLIEPWCDSRGIRGPRICDVDIPEDLKSVLNAYADKRGYGEKTRIPDFSSLCLKVYGKWSAWDVKMASLGKRYGSWYYPVWSKWFDNLPRQIGWNVLIIDGGDKHVDWSYSFSKTGKLRHMRVSWQDPLPSTPSAELVVVPTLETNVYFSQERVRSFRQQVPLSTFFPEQRRSFESAWPSWVIVTDASGKQRRRRGDFIRFIKDLQFWHDVVYHEQSRKPGRLFMAAYEEAMASLERARATMSYAWHRDRRQAFYFLDGPNGYGRWGYENRGRFGYFISKSDENYKLFNTEEISRMLLLWEPRMPYWESYGRAASTHTQANS